MRRLHFIDSWRAISVFAVIMSHLALNRKIAAFLESYGVGFLSWYGQTGVFVFFFISGYVVSKTLFAELEQTSTVSIGGFYIRRVFRILPPFMLYLLTYLVLGKLGWITYSILAFVRSALYLSNNALSFLPGDWYTGHTWSLAFEEQFYLVFPLLFVYLQCFRRPPLASALLLPVVLLPAIYPIYWIGRTGFIVIYILFLAGYAAARHPALVSFVLSKAPTTIFLVATLLTFAPINGFHSQSLAKFYKAVFPVSIPCAVLASAIPENYFHTLFRFRLVTYVGKISYSIYLWQQLLTGENFSSSSAWVQPALLLVLLVVCCISYEWMEKPLIALGRFLAHSRNIQINTLAL